MHQDSYSIIQRNLDDLRRRAENLLVCTEAHIDELAQLLLSARRPTEFPEGGDAFLVRYREITERFFPLDRTRPDENAATVGTLCRIRLCLAISEELAARGKPLNGEQIPLLRASAESSDAKGIQIAYCRNAYADIAYRRISEVLPGAAVTYPRDFNAVCKEVYYGNCRYCLLPLENTEEGILSGFVRLHRKYDLAPVLECTVRDASGAQSTRFALFAKAPERLFCSRGREIFCFRLNSPGDDSYLRTLQGMRTCGMRLLKSESIPITWDEGRYSQELSVECDGGNLPAFLLYLTLEIPEFTPIGLYRQLDDIE